MSNFFSRWSRRWPSRSLGMIGFFLLYIAQANALTFTITSTGLQKSNYLSGDPVALGMKFKSDAPLATYTIKKVIYDTDGKAIQTTFAYRFGISSASTTTLNHSWKVPANAKPGIYRYTVVVMDSAWKWISRRQEQQILVSPPVFTVTHFGPEKNPLNRGETAIFNDVIRSSFITNQKYNVTATIQDNYGLVLKNVSLNNLDISTGGTTLPVSYTLPTTMQIGLHRIKYTVKSVDNKTAFEVKQIDPDLALFRVEVVGGNISKDLVPSSLVFLKPRVATSNPMNGSGYIPNTNDKYTLVFSDEFSSSKLDTTKWWTRYVYSSGTLNKLNDECQRYSENNTHPIVNGVLKLTARPRPGTLCPNPKNDPKYTLWDSGMIRSKKLMKYGYFEARIKMPKGIGVWGAFWLNAEHSGWPPEIDIMEYVVNGVTEFHNMLHTGVKIAANNPQEKELLYNDPRYNTRWTYTRAPAAVKTTYLNDDFHVISGFWNDDDTYTTYLDGHPIAHWKYKWKNPQGADSPHAHILLNLAMGGGWPTAEWSKTMTNQPQELQIDYIRVYQKSNNIKTSTSTIGKNLCPADGGC